MNSCAKLGALLVLSGTLLGCGSDGESLPLDPTQAYVGFDEQRGYKVPLLIMGGKNVKWTSSNTNVAGVTGDDYIGVVRGNRAGNVTITARSGDASGSTVVTVEAYTVADRQAGETAATSLGCRNAGCHDPASADISPSTCGKHSASQILDAIRRGLNPEGGDISIGAARHSFNAPDSIVAYIRSLEPYGLPIHDF